MSQQWPGQEVQPAAVKPVVAVGISPDKQADNARADQGAANDAIRTDLAIEGRDFDKSKVRFEQIGKLRDDYGKIPEVRTYKVAVGELSKALKTTPNPQGDLSLVYSFAKAMDPDSVVREAEQGMVVDSQPWFQARVEGIKKQFGMDGAGQFSAEARAALRQELIRATAQRNTIYNARRGEFEDYAKRNGFDPYEVVGRHDGELFIDVAREYDQQRRDAGANVGQVGGGAPMGGQTEPGGQPLIDPNEGVSLVPQGGLPNAPAGTPTGNEQQIAQGPTKRVMDDALNAELFTMWKAGAPFESLDGYVKQKGYGGIDRAYWAQATQYAQKNPKWNPFGMYRDVPTSVRERMAGSGGAAYASAVGDGLTGGRMDEVAGAMSALTGGDYEIARDAFDAKKHAVSDAHPVLDAVGSITGGALGTYIGGGVLGRAAPGIAGAIGGMTPAARAAAGGATYGGYYGSGEENQNRVGGAVEGAVIGGALGGAIGKIGEKAKGFFDSRRAQQAAQPLTDGGEVIAAADRLNGQFGTNMAPIPADVGGATVGRLTGGAAQMPLSAAPIIKAAQNLTGEAKVARDAIAKMTGGVAQEGEQAGEAALAGAQTYMKRSKTKVDALYAKARAEGGDTPVDLVNARATLDQHIDELSQTPGGAAGLARMKALRAELDGPFPVEGVKRMRTSIRDDFGTDGLRSSDIERRMMQVADAADDDIVDSLVGQNKTNAARLYKEAANAHRERVEMIDEIIRPIIGKDGGNSSQVVFDNIDRLTKAKRGNTAALGKFLGALPAEDAATVRASIIGALGKSGDGSQTAAGKAFSLNDFLTHWNKMSPGAKGTMFGGELRSALDDLARVAEGTKGAQKYANHSNTGSTIGFGATTAGTPLGFLFAPVTTAGITAGQLLTGKLLASPKIARWLAKMPSQPGLIARHAEGLSKIAAADSSIAADALGLQRQIMDRLVATPSRAAADQGGENTTTAQEPQ